MRYSKVNNYIGNSGKSLFLILLVFCLSPLSAQDHSNRARLDSLSARAERYLEVSIDSVLSNAHQAILLAKKYKDWETVSDNYYFIHSAYYQESEMDSAKKYIRKAQTLVNYFDDEKKRVRIIHALGIINYKTGELDSALYYYQKEFELEKEMGREERQASALGNIGMVYYRQSKYQRRLIFISNV